MKLYFVHGYVKRSPVGGWFEARTVVEAMEMATKEFTGIYSMKVLWGKDFTQVCKSGLF